MKEVSKRISIIKLKSSPKRKFVKIDISSDLKEMIEKNKKLLIELSK